MSLALDSTSGFLPLGRHRTTEAEIRSRFVDHSDFATSSTRAAVWDEYELGRDLLRSKVRIHSVWIGGSFLTSKVDAKDIDALFIVNGRDYIKQTIDGRRVVDGFTPRRDASGDLVRAHGLNLLDSFLLMWSPFTRFNPWVIPEHTEYAVGRGYWDDWWPRDRYNKPDGEPPHWRDAIPLRGYLEVELDDFDR